MIGGFVIDGFRRAGSPPAPPAEPAALPTVEASATAVIAGYVELNAGVAVDTGAADALLVFVSVVSEHDWDPAVTHNGDGMALLARIADENTLWVFGRAGPDRLGAGTVAVASANSPGPGAIVAVALSGVDQSTPWEDVATAYGNPTATPSVDTTGASRLLVACGGNRFTGSSAPLTASGYTAIVSNTADAAHIVTALSRAADTAGSYGATVTTSTNGVTATLVAVKPA